MKPASWTFALTLALPLLAAAGCKDSKQNYIGFDAAPDASASDAKVDGARTDAATGDASRNDVAPEVLAADTPPAVDAASDAGADSDAASDGAADGDGDGAAADTEPGQ